MIREKKHVVKYPSKGILEDLATRIGPPNKESFTPFSGKADIIRDQFSGKQVNTFRMDAFLDENRNFEFDPKKVVVRKSAGIMELDEVEDNKYFLEDFIDNGVESDKIKEWVKSACIGYKKHKSSSYRQVDYTYSTKNYGEDDDSEFDPRMLQTVETGFDTSQEEYELAVRKLPFYIKAIWSYSVMFKANLFSFIAAYIDITKRRESTRIIISDFANYTLYALNKHGEYMRTFYHTEDVKTEKYTRVVDIFRKPYDNKEIYGLIKEFINTCNILNIKFENQDTSIFTNDFVGSLVCTYLPTTSEYFEYYGEVDVEVMYALKNDNLFAKTKLDIYSDPNSIETVESEESFVKSLEDRLYIFMKTLMEAPNPNCGRLFDGTPELAKKIINKYLYNVSGQSVDVSEQLDFDRGFLVYMKGKGALKVDGSIFGKCVDISEYEVYFMTNGTVIMYTGDVDALYILPADEAYERMCDYGYDVTRKNSWLPI